MSICAYTYRNECFMRCYIENYANVLLDVRGYDCIYACIISSWVYTKKCVHLSLRTCTFVYLYVCMYVFMYVCMYVCMYVYLSSKAYNAKPSLFPLWMNVDPLSTIIALGYPPKKFYDFHLGGGPFTPFLLFTCPAFVCIQI